MTKSFFLSARAVWLAVVLFFITTTLVLAHPLGNFTVNHYARLEIETNEIRVRYVLDWAEIPTFQEKQKMDADNNGEISDAERAAYLETLLPRLIPNLKLAVNSQDTPLVLDPGSTQFEFLEGQGGLQVMRVAMWLQAPFALSANGDAIEFQDKNFPERLGWREIVIVGGNGVSIQNSNVPGQDLSQELTAYPEELLNNPPNVRRAAFTAARGSGSSSIHPENPITTGALGAFDRTRDEFGKLVSANQELTPIVLLISFLAAIGLGALHAFSPGHGKAVVGAYLVGSRGNWQHAVFLGGVVTLTHTAGVYALGFVTLFLSAYVLPEQLFPWLGFISGLLVAIIGVQLFLQRVRAARSQTTSYDKARAHFHAHENGHEHTDAHPHHEHDHAHPHEHHHHEHAHDHQHETEHVHTHADGTTHSHPESANHPIAQSLSRAKAREPNLSFSPSHPHEHHSHDFATPEQEAAHAREHLAEIQALEKPSWRNLLSLGISGGLLPCPSALVVMLSAIALGRVLYGLFLIVGFSLGLAGVLVLTGLALLYAGKFAGRMFGGNRVGNFMRYVPIVGAFFVALLGIGIALEAFLQTGVIP